MNSPIATGGRHVNSAVSELADLPRWVCWRAVRQGDKMTKVPFTPAGSPASSTNPVTWSSFDECWEAAFRNGDFDGIGFVLDGASALVGIDLDGCVRNGTVEPWAAEIVSQFGSYAEISPSGTGLRIICRGKTPEPGRRNGKLEIYSAKRFLTITGAHLDGAPEHIGAAQPAIDALWAKHFSARRTKPNGTCDNTPLPPYPDQEAIDALLRDPTAAAYWRQDEMARPEGDDSPSGWDLAFASYLAGKGFSRELIAGCLRAYRAHHAPQKGKQDRPSYIWPTVDAVMWQPEVEEVPKANVPALCLTPKQWAAREIPPQDLLLGSIFTTTTRTQLIADTGLGKTMTGLGISFAIRLGRDFLAWAGHRQARVLIVDGEMPAELIKERLALAHTWFAVPEPISDGLWLLSREDLEDMPPLDRPEAKAWLLDLIDQLGGLDHITFDNIGALTGDCLKEEDGARVLKELQRELTKRRIGQLWLHHTGHDSSRGYGAKMREWHLDTVMVAEKLEALDADVSVTLKFPKSRRRTPSNRADYGPFEVVLRNGEWSVTASDSPGQRKGGLKPSARLCLDALNKAVAEFGTLPPHCSATAGVRLAVTVEQWRSIFGKMAPYTEDQADARRKAWQRGCEELAATHAIEKWDNWVWPTRSGQP